MLDYAAWYPRSFQSFRIPELSSLAELASCEIRFVAEEDELVLFQVQDDNQARQVVSRSIICKGVFRVYAQGRDWEALDAEVKQCPEYPFTEFAHDSYKFQVETTGVGKHSDRDEVRQVIEDLQHLDFKGSVDLKCPQTTWTLIDRRSENASILFTRLVGHSARHLVDRFSLKKREYLGNTSMESRVSLLTANMALARPGALCYDPFCGTGSFLLTCSAFGATTLGSDIDGRMIRGTPSPNGRTAYSSRKKALHKEGSLPDLPGSFRQYNMLQLLMDCIVFDVKHSPLRPSFKVDSVVSDPPYGVRAGARTLGRETTDPLFGRDKPGQLKDGRFVHDQPDYVPPRKGYELSELVEDLLRDSRAMLVDGGRLTFWLPTVTDEYKDVDIPQIAGMRNLYNSVQHFGSWGRRLLTYRREYALDVAQTVVSDSDHTPAHRDFRDKFFKGFARASERDLRGK
ncbi:hypothetical protein PYCC9005_001753 [Savitreella phatthalungensis]